MITLCIDIVSKNPFLNTVKNNMISSQYLGAIILNRKYLSLNIPKDINQDLGNFYDIKQWKSVGQFPGAKTAGESPPSPLSLLYPHIFSSQNMILNLCQNDE
jgi:hypothetical protein